MIEGRGPHASANVVAGVISGVLGNIGGSIKARRLAAARARAQGWRNLLRSWIAEEIEARRPFLWIPVAYGTGILLYFSASTEPSLWAPICGCILASLAAMVLARREHFSGKRAAILIAALFAGLTASALKTTAVHAPVIERTMLTKVTAYVETIDLRENSARLLLRPSIVEGLNPGQKPERIRVTMRGHPSFEAGVSIAATMRLLAPPRPAEPGGYDFSRDAFFQQIGAVGSITGQAAIAPDIQVGWVARINAGIDRQRNRLTQRIIDAVGGSHGPVAAALVTGKRGQISEETNEALRGAGIYHVVSISGLHMVLAAGLFLWSLRALLALFPGLVLKHPIKNWAAGFAMMGAIAYDLFSGSEVATERSLVMVLILLGAVIVGRAAFSMRNLAIAALAVLTIEPQTLTGPSFQMSFAAVAAMIAAFEKRIGLSEPAASGKTPSDEPGRDARATWFGRMRLVVGAMIVTTLVASLATDPYASYHFHRITPFGLIGNMLTLPLVEFVVMPAAVLGVVANPFGLDGPVWWLMGQGTWGMLEVAKWVAGLDGSTIHLPAFGPGALLLMTAGLIWMVLWQTPLRWLGIIPLGAGLWVAGSAIQPDIVVDRQGRSLAYRQDNGRLAVMNPRANPFGVSQWLTADADPRKPADPSLPGNSLCDPRGCTGLLRDGRTIVLVLEREAMAHDCARADILVTPIFAEGLCKGPELLIDGAHLQKFGAAQFRLANDGSLIARYARQADYDRPWSPAPRRPAVPSAVSTGWTAPVDGAVTEEAARTLDPFQ